VETLRHIRKSYFLIIATGLLLIIFSDYVGLFVGINNYFYDLSFRIRGARAPAENIIVAAIDEKTLDKLGRWPIKRTHYAALLNRVAEASVVGFDVILSEPSANDADVAESIKKHGRVILPVYFDTRMKKIEPLPILSAYRTGHVHVEQGIDNVVRSLFHSLRYGEDIVPSLSSVVYEIFTGKDVPRESAPEDARRPVPSKGILQTDPMRINYYGLPETFRLVSMADIIDGQYPSSFFSGKIVLVGITAPGIVDLKMTPFSQKRNAMAGIEVHANIINNLLDKNYVITPGNWLRWLLTVIISAVCFVLFLRTNEKSSVLLWFLAFFLIALSVFIIFSIKNIWLSPALFYFSVIFMFITAYLVRLDDAARRLDSEYSSVISLIGWEKTVKRKKSSVTGLVGFLSTGGINSKIRRLIQVEQNYERKLEYTVQKRTEELARALSMISTLSNEMILRLTKAAEYKDEDTGEHISRIGMYAKRISEELGMPSDFIDSISFASAMHDIGKIGIPDRILLKPGSLSYEEFEIMKTHATIGANILSESDYPKIKMSSVIAQSHHEKWDGTGYPNGLKGDEIPLEARIVMICDVYDALRSRRPYKPPIGHQETILLVTRGSDRTKPEHFDPELLAIFENLSDVFEEIFERYQE
jgi:response regulator RpfG family c-di-GMP phosphodiesterase